MSSANSDHITLNTKTPTSVPKHHTTTNGITRDHHYTTGDRGQLNTHYHQTTFPSSPQLTYDMTTDCKKTDGLSPTTKKLSRHNSRKTQSPFSLRPPYPRTYTLPT